MLSRSIIRTSCVMMYPKDGEFVNPDRGIGFWGYISRADMRVEVSACNDLDSCRVIAEAVSTSEPMGTLEGTSAYRWQVLAAVPEDLWSESSRSGKRTRVRAKTWIGIEREQVLSDGRILLNRPNFDLITVDEQWAQCASSVESPFEFSRACRSESHPYAMLYSEDYCPDWPDITVSVTYDEAAGKLSFAPKGRAATIGRDVRIAKINDPSTGTIVECEPDTLRNSDGALVCQVDRSEFSFESDCDYYRWRSGVRVLTANIVHPPNYFEFPGCTVEEQIASFPIPPLPTPSGCSLPENCDLLNATSSCPEGQGCYVRIGGSGTECLPAGDQNVGDSCVSQNSCVSGRMCLGISAQACWQVCRLPGTGPRVRCPSGQSCRANTETPPEFGVCTPD